MFMRARFKLEARQCLSGRYGSVAGVSCLYLLIPMILLETSVVGTFAGVWLLALVVMGPLLLARERYFLAVARGDERVTVGDFFGAFEQCIKGLAAYLWRGLFIALWALLLVVPGVVKMLAYSQLYFILADQPQLSIKQALKVSIQLTKGYKWELFVTHCSFIGWGILSLLTCGAGLVVLVPYRQLTLARMYLFMREKAIKNEPLEPNEPNESNESNEPNEPQELQESESTGMPQWVAGHEAEPLRKIAIHTEGSKVDEE